MASAPEVAWHSRFKKVLVESDCLLAVKLVNDSLPLSHPCSPILARTHHWISRDWEVQVVHIHKEGNCAADTMAGHALSGSLDLNIVHEAPAFLGHVLCADLEGRGSYCLCMAQLVRDQDHKHQQDELNTTEHPKALLLDVPYHHCSN
ncbi:ribonuclease H [Senna tora]|uniref:Ribonuclease H n=1 Tax=Senna tora TaxID=362788 RepID=A0A834W1W4_9FABA|nr:ribonuclease H [Senna tora]